MSGQDKRARRQLFYLLPLRCPWCGEVLSGHETEGLDPSPPRPDEVAVCCECRRVNVFERDGGGLRRATEQEASQPDVAAAVDAVMLGRGPW